MREQQADLWLVEADARVITTNGSIRSDGRAVMGRGVAKQATNQFYGIRQALGKSLRDHGNHVAVILRPETKVAGAVRKLWLPDVPIVSFPVKHLFHQPADLELIQRSTVELIHLTTIEGWRRVVLPRPGCHNGKRTWEEVGPILHPLLDERFVVVHLEGSR